MSAFREGAFPIVSPTLENLEGDMHPYPVVPPLSPMEPATQRPCCVILIKMAFLLLLFFFVCV